MENKHLFGQRLREARMKKGLTLEKFAHAVGVDPPAAFWWESGRNYPRTEKLIEIGEMLAKRKLLTVEENAAVYRTEAAKMKRYHDRLREMEEKHAGMDG